MSTAAKSKDKLPSKEKKSIFERVKTRWNALNTGIIPKLSPSNTLTSSPAPSLSTPSTIGVTARPEPPNQPVLLSSQDLPIVHDCLQVPVSTESTPNGKNRLSLSRLISLSSSRPSSPAPSGPSPAPPRPVPPSSPSPPCPASTVSKTASPGAPGTTNQSTNSVSLPPWEPIALDTDILDDLNKWNKKHAGERFPAFLEKIAKPMDSPVFKTLLDLIPNGTIPAGSLVKGIVAIMVLGMKIPERKQAAFDFAMQVVQYADVMAAALASSSKKTEESDMLFVLQCRDDLEPFCQVANEICKWAHDQVSSKFAFGDNEQVDLEKKLDHARMLFRDVSTIRVMKAISELGQNLGQLLGFNERAQRMERIKTAFGRRNVAGYAYGDQGKEACHPITRTDVLASLDDWIQHQPVDSTDKSTCLWLTGLAAVGKSAIAITTVKCLLDKRPVSPLTPPYVKPALAPDLYGQFFIHHKNDMLNRVDNLFPTLAFQLAQRSPIAAHIIDTALKHKPSLADEFSLEQAEKIFLEPIFALSDSSPTTVVIVIDGIDEFRQPNEVSTLLYRRVVSVLGQVTSKLPTNARILVLSRPDVILQSMPQGIKFHDLTTQESYADVEKYFDVELQELGSAFGWVSFPSEEQKALLCHSAAGHLGWAKQVVKWLGRRFEYADSSTLDDDIKDIGNLARGDLDAVYSLILERSLPPVLDSDYVAFQPELRKVLACLVAFREPQAIDTIHGIVKVDNNFNVFKCLQHLSSLYATGLSPIKGDTIPQPHKSFFDFISSSSRAPPKFFMDPAAAHAEVALRCFRVMERELHFNMGGFMSPGHNRQAPRKVSGHIVYACGFFFYHVERSRKNFDAEIVLWTQQRFLHWLEVFCLAGNLETPRSVLKQLENWENKDLLLLFGNGIDLINQFSGPISKSATTIYTTALPLSGHLRSLHQHSRTTSFVSAHCRTLTPTHITILECCISNQGEWVVLFVKRILFLASLSTGTTVWSKPVSQSMRFLSTSFSSDDKTLIVSDYLDRTRKLFGVKSGDLIREDTLDVPHDCSTIPVLKRLAALHRATGCKSDYHNLDVQAGKLVWCQNHWDDNFVCIPNADDLIAVVDTDWVKIINFRTETVSTSPRKSAAFPTFPPYGSPSGHFLAFTEGGKTLIIWSVLQNKEVARLPEATQSDWKTVCWSPDGRFLAAGLSNGAISIWSCSTWTCITTLYGQAPCTRIGRQVLKFHPNGNRIISASNNEIRIWDISAVVAGREFDIILDEGPAELAGWFKHGICLGGWYRGQPFVYKYPFKLPEGVKQLDWNLEVPAWKMPRGAP